MVEGGANRACENQNPWVLPDRFLNYMLYRFYFRSTSPLKITLFESPSVTNVLSLAPCSYDAGG